MSDFRVNTDGHIEKGDDKQIRFEPTDNNGNAAIVSSIDFTATKPDGSTVSKTKADFSEDDDVWTTDLSFDQTGVWGLKLDASDGTHSEVSTDKVYVREA